MTLLLGGLLVLSVLPLLGAAVLDLVWRAVSFRWGLRLLGLYGLPALVAPLLLEQSASNPWRAVGKVLPILAFGAMIFGLCALLLVAALSVSRAIRPGEQPWRWRKGRLAGTLAVNVVLSMLLLLRDDAALGLPVVWGCTPALLAFARDGGPRLEGGGAAAVGLLGASWLSLLWLVVALDLADALQAAWNPVRVPSVSSLFEVTALALLPVGATALAIWRRPDPEILWATLPCACAWAALFLYLAVRLVSG